jgi:ABC-type lipoprotein export system ATPase subunit
VSNYPRGSGWRIWDLHVHTPDSIEHGYSGADPWDRYLSELAALPPDIKVVGINDYWFLSGYRIVREALERGDLPNIEQVFPVLEVRCDTFGGVDGHLSRINLHMICDPLLSVETLEAQLQPLMKATYRLTLDSAPTTWSQFPTKESLIELGKQIIESAPEKVRHTFPQPLKTGFNNLNVSFERIRTGIVENSVLDHHVALALGKVEWADIKWTQQAAAQKKHLINSVDAVFTASPSLDAFRRSRASLSEAEVLDRLLDCSDAHHWSDSNEAARLGACHTWLNADPSFKGLMQALQEYDARVCVDERPEVLTRLARSPRTVIDHISIRQVEDGKPTEPLFSTELPVNAGFAVVIGNKGQGKSALLDSVALAANSDRHDDFSFLGTERFRSGGGRTAAQYEVELTWADGSKTSAGMNDRHDSSSPVLVDYLPQSLIEKVCSADPESTEKRQFETEIERVLFRHIDAAKRGTATTLTKYLEGQGQDERSALEEARYQIASVSRDLLRASDRRDTLLAMGLGARLADLNAQLVTLEAEAGSVDAQIKTGGSEEQSETAQAVAAAVVDRDTINERLALNSSTQESIRDAIGDVVDRAAELVQRIAESRRIAEEIASAIGAGVDRIFTTSFDPEMVNSWRGARENEIRALVDDVESPGGLAEQFRVASRRVTDLQGELSASGEEVQRLQQQHDDLLARIAKLNGDPADEQSIAGVNTLIHELERIPSELSSLQDSLEESFRAVHGGLMSIRNLQKEAYRPATEFIDRSELAEGVGLAFDVEFRARGFLEGWLGMVNRQKLGDFYDLDRRDRDLQILADVSFEDVDALHARLQDVVARLGRERGSESGGVRPLHSIMRASYEAHELVSAIYDLRWLESQYIIRSEGAELSELSPGQRGLVLLLFYLLVDTSERPLLLDQPEENLDNQTVRTSLVPAMREATSRRQVLAVTHNPNLAVVGDADQIIVATASPRFEYASGSLAELPVGQAAIDVLEGTRGAFNSREVKYDQVVGR